MHKRFFKVLIIVVGLASLAATSHATLTAVDPGPYTAATGYFPLWYRDGGVPSTTLDLCLSKTVSSRVPVVPGDPPAYMCTLLPNAGIFDDTLPIVFPYNFPDEAFWFTADASIDEGGVSLTYTAALEAAFSGGVPAPGDQISFARIRIRADLPTAAPTGTYTVIHPYGVENVSVTAAGKKAINLTRDIGIGATGVFTGALNGDVWPFLQSINSKAQPKGFYEEKNPETGELEYFVGDPNIVEEVTGSRFNTNFVQILGPQGSGIDYSTNLFSVSGKVWNGAVPTALNVDRSTYTRIQGSTKIDVFASSPPDATVTFRETLAGADFVPPLTGDGLGRFYGQDPTPPATLPPFVVVTAKGPNATPLPPPTRLASPLVDLVQITRALYVKSNKSLIIEASSSDQVVVPTLRAMGFGNLTPGQAPFQQLIVSPVAEPPATVTVKSSAGGSDTEPVIVTASTPPVVTPPGNISVAAPQCATSVPASNQAIINFLGNATATDNEDGNLTAFIINNAPVNFPLGVTTVTFSVVDKSGVPGSATATVTVTGGNTAPVVTAPVPITVVVPAGATSVPRTNAAIAAFLAGATATDLQSGNLTGSITNNAPVSFPLGGTTVTFSVRDNCGLLGSATSTVTVRRQVDLDISIFTVPSTGRLNWSVDIVLRVRNRGSVNAPMPATVVGVQNGVTVYNQTMMVNDPVGGGSTQFNFPAFTPTLRGTIRWRVTIQDENPDTDTANRNTFVR